MQSGRLANLAQRQARSARTLKRLASNDADLIALAVNARELRLSALDLGAGLVLGVLWHAGSLFARCDTGEGRGPLCQDDAETIIEAVAILDCDCLREAACGDGEVVEEADAAE